MIRNLYKPSSRIIGICGHMKVGKDTVADMISTISKHDYIHYKFSDKLTDVLKVLTDTPDISSKNTYFKDINMTAGVAMQKLGTDAIRNNFHKDIFVIALKNKWAADNYPNIIISDVRFQNEVDFIKKHNGVLIRVSRNLEYRIDHMTDNRNPKHESEKNIVTFDPDIVVNNNNSFSDLETKIIDTVCKYDL